MSFKKIKLKIAKFKYVLTKYRNSNLKIQLRDVIRSSPRFTYVQNFISLGAIVPFKIILSSYFAVEFIHLLIKTCWLSLFNQNTTDRKSEDLLT